ncbi:hypothetical protein VTI74DRAFT_9039 [Chaetomium olivicolor]
MSTQSIFSSLNTTESIPEKEPCTVMLDLYLGSPPIITERLAFPQIFMRNKKTQEDSQAQFLGGGEAEDGEEGHL